jgi:hypothetical protein
MPVEIRTATPEDAGTIAELNVDVQQIHADAHPWRFKPPGPYTFTEKDAQDLLGNPGYFAFLAFDEGVPTGSWWLKLPTARRRRDSSHMN